MPRGKRTLSPEEKARRVETLKLARAAKVAKANDATLNPPEDYEPVKAEGYKPEPQREKLGPVQVIEGKPFRQVHVPITIARDNQSWFRDVLIPGQCIHPYDEGRVYTKVEEHPPQWGMPSVFASMMAKGYRVDAELSPQHRVMSITRERWEAKEKEYQARDLQARTGRIFSGDADEVKESHKTTSVSLQAFMDEQQAVN